MRVANYNFRPRLLPSLITLALLPLLIALGFWQLGRADQKYAARALREQRLTEQPRALSSTDRDVDAMLARRVTAQGRLDLQHQFLLQNQLYQEQPGYEVYTPLQLRGGAAVLVDRGWIAAHLERAQAPNPGAANVTLAITAVVDTPPSIGLKLGAPDGGNGGWPRQVQYLDLDWAQRQLGYDLLPYVLLPEKEVDPALAQTRRPEHIGERGMPPEKHLSYAVQWFALAVALLVIYVVVNTRRISGEDSGET